MKETRTINLNGLVYHIDYDAYKILCDYLNDIELRLAQDERAEIMSDIEARIAELFQKILFAKNVQVINLEMVQSIQQQIGLPSEFGPNKRPKVKEDKSKNSGCGRIFSILLNVILAILALPVLFFGLIILFALIFSLFSIAITGTASIGMMPIFGMLADLLLDGGAIIIPFLLVALLLIIILPIVMVVHTIITFMRTRRGPKARFWWITILFWIASLVLWGSSLVRVYHSYKNIPTILNAMSFEDLNVDDEGLITSALQLDAYHSIQLHGAAEMILSNSSIQSTQLTTNIIKRMNDGTDIQVEVRDSILYIHMPTSHHEPIIARFAIEAPEIRNISVFGAAKIATADDRTITQPTLALDINGAAEADMQIDVENLKVDSKGASQLQLEGLAKEANITIAGAGKLEADDLTIDNLHINCAGVSHAEVHVTHELWAQAAGASKILYQGNARIKSNMAVGGSTIKKTH
jgi:hypothetical protein